MAWTTPRTWVAGELVTATQMNTHLRDNLNVLKTSIDNNGNLSFPAATTINVSSSTNTAVPIQNVHKVDSSTGGALNLTTLSTTNVLQHFMLLLFGAAPSSDTITLKDGLGNVSLQGGDYTFDSAKKFILLTMVGTSSQAGTWYEVARAGGGGSTFLPSDTTIISRWRDVVRI